MLKAERLVAITLLLQARGKMTAQHLAEVLDVSVRTIYRDMDSLSLAHIPVSMDYGPGGGYFLPDDYRLDPSTFTSGEAMALAVGGALADSTRLFGSSDDLRRALFKMEAILPEECRPAVQAVRQRILFDAGRWYSRQPDEPHLEAVRTAIWDGRRIAMQYHGANGSSARTVEPYGLVCKAGIWYLVAFCLERQDFRIFRLDRIEEVSLLQEAVTPRPDFDLHSYWEETLQRFEGRVPRFAVTVQIGHDALHRLWDYELIENRDNGAVVRIVLDSREDAVRHALWFGADAVIIDPPDLAAEVLSIIEAMQQRYASVRNLPEAAVSSA